MSEGRQSERSLYASWTRKLAADPMRMIRLLLEELGKWRELSGSVRAHGDIRPESIRVIETDDGQISFKFGPRVDFSDSSSTETGGRYHEEGEDPKSDLYSLGYVFLFLVLGTEPKNIEQYYFNSVPFRELVKGLTNPMNKRISLEAALESEFFKKESLPLCLKELQLIEETPKVPEQFITDLKIDLKFLIDTESPQVNCYQQLLNIAERLRKDHEDESEEKKEEEEEEEVTLDPATTRPMQVIAFESLKSAVLYQSYKRYAEAKHCYMRSILAFKCAIELLKQQCSSETVQACLLSNVTTANYFELNSRT